jgi:hypothetical protein
MHGLERLHASLDRFFESMALNTLPIGERVTECFCETLIADGTLRYLPDDEVQDFEGLMKYHLGVGLDDFDEDHMRDLFVTRDYFILRDFVSALFKLKDRLRQRIGSEVA